MIVCENFPMYKQNNILKKTINKITETFPSDAYRQVLYTIHRKVKAKTQTKAR